MAFVITWINLEGIGLNVISQTKKDKYIVWYHLYVESEKVKLKNRVGWWLPGTGAWGTWGNVSQKLQTFSYKMNTFWESNVQW